jgi:hypothetical protein
MPSQVWTTSTLGRNMIMYYGLYQDAFVGSIVYLFILNRHSPFHNYPFYLPFSCHRTSPCLPRPQPRPHRICARPRSLRIYSVKFQSTSSPRDRIRPRFLFSPSTRLARGIFVFNTPFLTSAEQEIYSPALALPLFPFACLRPKSLLLRSPRFPSAHSRSFGKRGLQSLIFAFLSFPFRTHQLGLTSNAIVLIGLRCYDIRAPKFTDMVAVN